MRDQIEAASREEEGAGSPESFEEFFEAEHPRLYGTLCLVTGNAGEAEDVMQEAFFRVWTRWDRVRGHPDPPGYLYRTAFNLVRDRSRRSARALRRLLVPDPPDDPLRMVEERDALFRALRRLTRRQRAALVLTELLEFTAAEAAEVLGVKPATVRALAWQGRGALRDHLGGNDG